MAGTWSILEGTHRVEDGPRYRDDIIGFTNTTGTAVPTCGQYLSDVISANDLTNYETTLGWGVLKVTGTDANATYGAPIEQVSGVRKATKNKDHVTIRFRQWYTVSA